MTKKDETAKSESVVRIAAAADLHCTKNSRRPARAAAGAAWPRRWTFCLLGGDLTDFGLPEEAHVLVRELNAVKVPMVAVLGNHDFESGKQDEIGKS